MVIVLHDELCFEKLVLKPENRTYRNTCITNSFLILTIEKL